MVTLQLPVFLRLSWGSLVREFTVDARFWQQSWHKFLSVPNATRARGGAGCRYQVPASRMVRIDLLVPNLDLPLPGNRI